MNVTKKSKNKSKKTTNVSYTVESFGKKLIELRNEKGITQEESAKLIGITRNSLSMYERGERCPNIDIAVSTANAYNVSLDYLFGTGYKKQRNNEYNMYEMGFSEEALDFLCIEDNRYYVNAILSDPRIQKISDILYGSSYKPLINSYEMNYISRLVSDLLYNIIVDVTKGSYELRPMFEEEIEELLDAINDCIRNIESTGTLLCTDYDKYVDCEDTLLTELEKIKSLLENTPATNYNQAREAGFSSAIKFLANNEIQLISPNDLLIKENEKLQKYITKIPIIKRIHMSTDQLFSEAKKMMENDEKNNIT